MPRGFWGQIFSGKSVYRSCMNLGLAGCAESAGRILDIGGTKKIPPSYREYFKLGQAADIRVLNIDAETEPDFLADAAAIPCGDAEFDCVWCINTIEHVAEPQKVVAEAYRVLKPGGKFTINTPFIYRIHGHPEDYTRFTDTGLRHLAESAGFTVAAVRPAAVGVFQAALAQVQILSPRAVFIPLLALARSFDRIVARLKPKLHASWALGFIAECRK